MARRRLRHGLRTHPVRLFAPGTAAFGASVASYTGAFDHAGASDKPWPRYCLRGAATQESTGGVEPEVQLPGGRFVSECCASTGGAHWPCGWTVGWVSCPKTVDRLRVWAEGLGAGSSPGNQENGFRVEVVLHWPRRFSRSA
jgi:hypothetical protein